MDRQFSCSIIFGLILCLSACGQNKTSTNEKEPEKKLHALAKEEEVLVESENPPELQKAAQSNVELGLNYLAQGQVARAKTKLNYALKLGKNLPEPHSAMAYLLEQVGDLEESEKEHKKAVRYSKGKGAMYNNYGAFLCRRARFKEADQAFNQALKDKQYSRFAEVYENAGVCAMQAEELVLAEEYLQKSLQQDGKRTGAVLALVNLNIKNSNYFQAKSLLQHYKQIAEPNARSLWLSIQLYDILGDKDAVASSALMLKNLFENSPEYQEYEKSNIGKT